MCENVSKRETGVLDLQMGDLTFVDSGDLGVDVYAGDEKVTFFNSMGANTLAEWLTRRMRLRINKKYNG